MSTSENPLMISATDVFWLRPAARRGQLIVDYRDQNSPWLERELEHALFRGMRTPSTPIVFDHSGGSRAVDFIHGSTVALGFMSPRMIEVLRSHGFTGWQTWPAEVHGKDGVLLPGYQGLAVTGRCGGKDFSRLTREDVIRPRVMVRYRATVFDLERWNGHDFFAPDGTLFIFVTRRVRDALLRARLKGLELTPLTELWLDEKRDEVPAHLRPA
ncbi:hypothetical protein L6R53_01075 [Myxococcota bacterium]|nr:hypothetical protein [Myxococcota bacterium]